MTDSVGALPQRLCSGCSALSKTEKTFCPQCGRPYGSTPSEQQHVLTGLSAAAATVSLLLLPILFGPAAIALAAVGIARKERFAAAALAYAIVAMIFGFALGVLATP
jgi:uncharacterized paraquat-inducible protein A